MVAKMPSAKVMTSIVFCRGGSRMPVSTGMGSARMARSVTTLTGAEQMNSVSSGIQRSGLTRMSQAALTGWHWKMFMMVRMVPATLTTPRTAHDAMRMIFCVFFARRR